MRTLAVEIVSDVVCPWCLIGIRRLEQAFERFDDVEPQLTFRPFLLDPSTPAEGADLRARLERKYGVPAEQLFARVEEAARASGIPLDFARIRRSVNTISAHTLLRHALPRGTQVALKKALLSGYFLEGRDVGDADVLAAIASDHGFEPDETQGLVSDEGERAATVAEARAAVEEGVTGVPFIRIGTRFGIPGAQSPDVFASAIARQLQE